MISWKDAKPIENKSQKMIFGSKDWDQIFSKIDPENLKPKYRNLYRSIKSQYESKGCMSEKQATAVHRCWKDHCRKDHNEKDTYEKDHNEKESRRRGISARSFRGIPRMVYEPGVF